MRVSPWFRCVDWLFVGFCLRVLSSGYDNCREFVGGLSPILILLEEAGLQLQRMLFSDSPFYSQTSERLTMSPNLAKSSQVVVPSKRIVKVTSPKALSCFDNSSDMSA